ncbi:40S ribosomal protein S21 [Ascosphaera pollenicola]|nr:40S ribosomal protein S21 [Ascosphaera pollenicola]
MSATEQVSEIERVIVPLRKVLINEEEKDMGKRYRALFSLKYLACQQPPTELSVPAIEAIAAAFASESELLKHECAYCLGQTRNEAAVSYLQECLKDESQHIMCRHEAGEALGALNHFGSLDLLRKVRDDETQAIPLRETCELAVARIEYEHSKLAQEEKLKKRYEKRDMIWSDFVSIDPAPPLPLAVAPPTIDELKDILIDEKQPLFQRYRAMFALRDLASPPDLPTARAAVDALSKALMSETSALFKHEVAFVFGQLCHPASIPALVCALSDVSQAPMVRHEAAEALGDMGDEPGVEIVLRKHLNDPEPVVKESCIVALDMAEYEKSQEKEYALIPQ